MRRFDVMRTGTRESHYFVQIFELVVNPFKYIK